MGVARDSHRRCIYYPEHVYTWVGYSSHSVSLCVCVCLYLIASLLLLVLPSIQLVVSSVLFDGTFLQVSIYPFQLSCLAWWLFRLLLSASFLEVTMTF